MVKHIVNGMRGNEETLVVDVISKARPLSQSITEKYTLNHLKPWAKAIYEKALGGCPTMAFCPNSSEFSKNNARNIIYMAVLIFCKFLDFNQNSYSRTAS